MTELGLSSFSAWSERWLKLAAHPEGSVRDPHVAELLELWEMEIPGKWQRGADSQLLDPTVRYRRGDLENPHPGEHALEHHILGPDPKTVTTTCFGLRLLDGINAVPLARDEGGGRAGNVEADMLLLTGNEQHRRLLLVEAKTSSNTALYATVESLRQLRLFCASDAATQIMSTRHPERDLSSADVTAVVLAPAGYYSPSARTGRSIKPAKTLIDAFKDRSGLDLRLATWDSNARTITELTGLSAP